MLHCTQCLCLLALNCRLALRCTHCLCCIVRNVCVALCACIASVGLEMCLVVSIVMLSLCAFVLVQAGVIPCTVSYSIVVYCVLVRVGVIT